METVKFSSLHPAPCPSDALEEYQTMNYLISDGILVDKREWLPLSEIQEFLPGDLVVAAPTSSENGVQVEQVKEVNEEKEEKN